MLTFILNQFTTYLFNLEIEYRMWKIGLHWGKRTGYGPASSKYSRSKDSKSQRLVCKIIISHRGGGGPKKPPKMY